MKLIIVDDEYLFRQALKVSIDFESLGLEIVGEAKNGKEAIGLLEDYDPDIALVDINMPIIDGLEFARYIRENELGTKVIIISGYDHFDYAKEAIHQGVYSYLLKPVDEEELQKELQELIKVIEVEQSADETLSNLKQQVDANKPILREQMIRDILMGHYDRFDENLNKKLAYLDIEAVFGDYSVQVFDLVSDAIADEDTMEVYRMNLEQIINKLYGRQCLISYDHMRRLCVIVAYDDHMNHDRMTAYFGSMQKHMKKLKEVSLVIGISTRSQKIDSVSTAYSEALTAVSHCQNYGQSHCFYEMISDKGHEPLIISKDLRNELLIQMRTGRLEEVKSRIRLIFDIVSDNRLNLNHIRYICMELASVCLSILAEIDDSDLIREQWIEELYDENTYYRSVDDLSLWMVSVFEQVMSKLEERNLSRSDSLVQDIKKYVDDHYSECDFTIDAIAKALFVNYSHLCYTFKKQTQTTINEYLTDKRMSHAANMMDEGHTVVKNIAERVGYADSGYFGKSFKKYMGVTPSQYINAKN